MRYGQHVYWEQIHMSYNVCPYARVRLLRSEDKDDEEMGKCLHCGAIQVISEEQEVLLQPWHSSLRMDTQSPFRAFHNVLKNITEVCGPITLKSLLNAHPSRGRNNQIHPTLLDHVLSNGHIMDTKLDLVTFIPLDSQLSYLLTTPLYFTPNT